ncbi:MAG TPA: hypothetical protein VHA78_05015 [Candidatus Peribacteraceae bacterium]|nr:hypothetical protein [Candidatus Peribacteraceae bacterium]
MTDQSHLDNKYFIDWHIYNCPFCNRRHVSYDLFDTSQFDWSNEKTCYIYIVRCRSCEQKSMHLSYEKLDYSNHSQFQGNIDLDTKIFYSVPTSFFTVDSRIPNVIRELITEAEGCLKMNFLTGASACMRKAIYELTVIEKAEGEHYEDRIKALKGKYPSIDSTLFDVLAHIQNMTSDKVHEQSWEKWDSQNLTLIIETLKAVLHEIYVLPDEKKKRSNLVQQLKEKVMDKKNEQPAPIPEAEVKS